MNYREAIKYPKTFHFDFSDSLQNDDRRLETLEHFEGKDVVVTIKMDGENSTVYKDYFHPRSVQDDGHESRNWLKGHIAKFQWRMNGNHRICGENMYAEHSIRYEDLDTFFYVFSMWENDPNVCMSWMRTTALCNLYGLEHVPVLYEGRFNYEKIKKIYQGLDIHKHEGIVVRVADEFKYEDFQTHVAKAVRPNHVATDEHWKKTWKPNQLKK